MVCLLLFDRHTYTAAWRREDCMKHGMTAASVGLLAGALVLSAPIGLFRAGTAHAGEELSLNRASVQELTELEGGVISETLARNIVEHRREHGPSKTAADLLRVPGVKPELLDILVLQERDGDVVYEADAYVTMPTY